jgi:protein tyrosine/serine phosphatase
MKCTRRYKVKKAFNKILKTASVVIIAVAVLVGARLFYVKEQGNFHVVRAGEVYRSAQLDDRNLNRYIKQYGIRTIVNLRGEHNDAKWYKDEIRISKKYNVRHYNLGLNATKSPNENQISRLIKIFRTAARPVLLHCKAGADRAGLASAIWLTAIDGVTKDIADDQLSIKFGHMPVGPTQAMDRFFAKWEPPMK